MNDDGELYDAMEFILTVLHAFSTFTQAEVTVSDLVPKPGPSQPFVSQRYHGTFPARPTSSASGPRHC